jgi:hypothetical protein
MRSTSSPCSRRSGISHRLPILVYPCNLLGYVRLGLIGAAAAGWLALPAVPLDARLTLVGFLLAASALDALDGPLARRLGHATRFGARLDQSTDLLGATLLWLMSGFSLGPALIALEWAAGLAVLLRPHTALPEPIPLGRSFMRRYFANRQRNPLSILANASHLALPIALFLGAGFEPVAYAAIPGLIAFELATALILAAHVRREVGQAVT